MSGEPVTKDELFTVFEAARWAPSCFNAQPWRFFYAMRESSDWLLFLSFLKETNQVWADRAGALVVVASNTVFEAKGNPNALATFDAGAAWGYLALQGSMNGLVVHGMAGFDFERAKTELGLPPAFKVEAMAAVGRPGSKDTLPAPLQEREKPSDRKPLSEVAVAGRYRA